MTSCLILTSDLTNNVLLKWSLWSEEVRQFIWYNLLIIYYIGWNVIGWCEHRSFLWQEYNSKVIPLSENRNTIHHLCTIYHIMELPCSLCKIIYFSRPSKWLWYVVLGLQHGHPGLQWRGTTLSQCPLLVQLIWTAYLLVPSSSYHLYWDNPI